MVALCFQEIDVVLYAVGLTICERRGFPADIEPVVDFRDVDAQVNSLIFIGANGQEKTLELSCENSVMRCLRRGYDAREGDAAEKPQCIYHLNDYRAQPLTIEYTENHGCPFRG